MNAIATLDGVSVTYPFAGRPAVSEISLQVEPGQLVLLAGPSGCGKSTVMRVINGLIPNAYRAEVTGTVTVAGKNTNESAIHTISETVGTLLQNPGRQVMGHSVQADIAFGLENRALPAHVIQARVDGVASELGIDDGLMSASTHELSGGQLQLVAFAGVLVTQPRLIVVDEPLANLDPDTASRTLQAIREYVDGGGAAIVIEHRVDELAPFDPDAVIYLEEGRTRYHGDLKGFLRAADPASVRLPFTTLLARAAALSPQQHPEPTKGTGTVLRYRQAELGYGDSSVIHHATADFAAGQRIAVIGPVGAGKSTLLRASVGLVDILSGTVELLGRPVAHYPAVRLATLCGYLFQNPAQALFAPTVADEVAFGPRNLGKDAAEIETICAHTLHAVGLSDLPAIMSRLPRTLSFGEQRRLALAAALALQPSTLILDEPTAGQDERSVTHLLDAVWSLPGVDSVYFITHDVDLALWRSDRIIVIHDGRIVAAGTPSNIVHDESLWYAQGGPSGRSILRESDYVRAARLSIEPSETIPPPRELARRLAHL